MLSSAEEVPSMISSKAGLKYAGQLTLLWVCVRTLRVSVSANSVFVPACVRLFCTDD